MKYLVIVVVVVSAVSAVSGCDSGSTVCGAAGLCCPSSPENLACSSCTGTDCTFTGPNGLGNRCCPHSGTQVCSNNGVCVPGLKNPAMGACNCTSKPYSGDACETFGANLTAITDQHCHQLSIGDSECSRAFWSSKGYQFSSYSYHNNLPCPPRFGFQEKTTTVCPGPDGATISVWGLGAEEEVIGDEEEEEEDTVAAPPSACRIPWSGVMCATFGGAFHNVNGAHCWELDISNSSCAHSYWAENGWKYPPAKYMDGACPSTFNLLNSKTVICDTQPQVVAYEYGIKP